MADLATTLAWLAIAIFPLGLSVWALLDAARRPAWAWALAGRSQLVWIGAIAFGIFLLAASIAVSGWYLLRIRPAIAAVEAGDLSE